MEQKTETIVTTAKFNPGKTETILVRLAGYITEIVFRFGLNVEQASGALGIEDGILRMIKGLKFTASNVLDWYTIRDGREGFYLDYIKTQGSPYAGDAAAAALAPPDLPASDQEGRDVEVQFVFHPGIMPGNPFDLTRCIPLRGKSNVQVEVTWGTAAADLSALHTIDAAKSDGLSIEVSRVILEPGETEKQAFAPLNHIFVPRLLPVTYPIDAEYGAFSFSLDVLTGAYIRDAMFLVIAEDGDRSSGELEQYRVRNNKGELYNVRRSWIGFEREMKRRFYLPALKAGLALQDFRGVTTKDYGLNMVQASKGDWMLEFSTAKRAAGKFGEIWTLYEAADLVSVDPTVVGT